MNDVDGIHTIERILSESPTAQALNLRCVSVDGAQGTVSIVMPSVPANQRERHGQQFHGGAIASLADTACCFAVMLRGATDVPTINLRIDYLRPAVGPELRAIATPLRVGRSLAVVDVRVLDQHEQLVAVGRGTFGSRRI